MSKRFGFTVVACVLLTSVASRAWSATINVCKSGCAYSTIQAGIDAAHFSDTVLIGSGVYYERIVFAGKQITVKSVSGPFDTTIDGSQGGTVVTFDSGSGTSVIDGFTIKNGKTANPLQGGGINNAQTVTPTIKNCVVTANTAVDGGGVVCWRGAITNCTISNNTASSNGGGIRSIDAVVSNCVIAGNSAKKGGGYYGWGIISKSSISGNTATTEGGGLWTEAGEISDSEISGNATAGTGGGYYGYNKGTITRCTVKNNSASWGGGIANVVISNSLISGNHASGGGGGGYNITASHCIVSDNSAEFEGGGVCASTISDSTISGNYAAQYGGGAATRCEISNCIISNNASASGGGVFKSNVYRSIIRGNTATGNGGGAYDSDLANSTVSGNYAVGMGGGLFVGGALQNSNHFSYCTVSGNRAGTRGGGLAGTDTTVSIAYSIIWGNTDDPAGSGYDEVYISNSTLNISGSDIMYNWQGSGNFDSDPLFVNPVAATAAPTVEGNYHIKSESPCLNKAETSSKSTDVENDVRPNGTACDVGSDEFYPLTLATALDAPRLWRTGGTKKWLAQTAVTYDGVDTAKSGKVGNYGSSWLQATVAGPATISFWWKTSSEAKDMLRFYVDGKAKASRSGINDWKSLSFPIASGTHVVKWQFKRNASKSAGVNAGYVDQVTIKR